MTQNANWGQELIDLYDKNQDQIGVMEYRGEIPYTLLPLYHSTLAAQITVTIYQDGTFLRAEVVDPGDKMTVIPVTEKSGSRTSGKEPHPLCDQVRYLAGDYGQYSKEDQECYVLYMPELEKWAFSSFSHEKVKAIYEYLKKKMLVRDLVEQGIVKLNEENEIDKKETIQGIEPGKALVRFIIRPVTVELEEEIPDECWKDRSLQECFINYLRSQGKEEKEGLCYLTGNVETISYLHGKKIRNEGDGAKLISANDSQNFTYRGRFANKEEAFAIGNESSQKLHNALRWMIRKQGTFFDTQVFVTWETSLQNMPRWDADTEAVASGYEEQDEKEDVWDDEEESFDGNYITAKKFYSALRGYGKTVDNTSSMVLMGFDAATPGRLAMVEETRLESSRYLENIKKWHESCSWIHEKWKDGSRIRFFGMVGVRDIADILYGIESKGGLTIADTNGKKLYAEVARRLIPCIWNGHRVPMDYVSRAVNKASAPLAYKERRNWERVLALACSLVKKSRMGRNEQEEWNVALDRKEKNRNYLYGRLLAVADRIEYRTYEKDETARVTNAKRYMNTFSQRPYETWKVIEESIQPYLNKLKVPERIFLENLLNEIYDLFEKESFQDNSRLEGLYLLGFHSQAYDLKAKKEDKEEEE